MSQSEAGGTGAAGAAGDDEPGIPTVFTGRTVGPGGVSSDNFMGALGTLANSGETISSAFAGLIGLGAAFTVIGVSGGTVVRASLLALAAIISSQTVVGLTATQALVAGVVTGPAIALGMAAGILVTGFALQNGIHLFNRRAGTNIPTPNAILGREFFPVIER